MRLLLRTILLFVLVTPILVLVLYAGSSRWFFPALLPDWSLEPVLRQLTSQQVQAGVLNSTLIALVTTLLALVIGLPAARVLGLRQFPGRSIALLLLVLPTLVPPLATGMGLNILFLRLNLAGNLAGVILVHLIPVLPYVVLALIGVFVRYDETYEQQARSLGANWWVCIWQVMLPLAGPGIAVAALFAFLVSWSQYVLTLLIGGGRVLTLPMLLFAAVSGGNPATIASLALLFAAPPLLAIMLAARALVENPERVMQLSYGRPQGSP